LNQTQFFIICQPGLEHELKSEIEEFWPYLIEKDAKPQSTSLKIQEETLGGILIECSEVIGYQINFFSKLASRVLLRLDQFKATDFGKLKGKLSKIQLNSYFGQNQFRIEIAASKSRLNNEKRIHEVCEQVWKDRISEKAKFCLYIRVYDDQFTVSLDTSGEHLHFRSGEKKIGDAPLRETLAAFMIRNLIQGLTLPEIQKLTLTDPMAGSGTLLKEASFLYQPNFGRDFSFLHFQNCPKILKTKLLEKNYPQFPSLFEKLVACDRDDKMFSLLKENLKNLNAEIHQQDLFHGVMGSGLLLTNPPYGERLKAEFEFSDLAHALLNSHFQRVGVLLPQSAVSKFDAEASKHPYHQMGLYRFKNGGIPVVFLVFARASL